MSKKSSSRKNQSAKVTSETIRRIEEARKNRATKLNLSGLGIIELDDSISQMSELQNLDLSDNQLTRLPESIGKLSKLQSLALHANQLNQLPESIIQLSALEFLDLRSNQLSQLPESVSQLFALQELNLYKNKLTELPESIGKLTALRFLDIDGNELTELPDAIGKLTALETIYVQGNRLTRLPESIGKLTALQELHLSENWLTQLPNFIGKLSALKSLYSSDNQLTELPESIGKLSKLQYLDLSGNQLTELPDAIGKLSGLETVYIQRNWLTRLPESIGKLSALKSLFLSDNRLTQLPESIGKLYALQYLDLSGNRLAQLPESMRNFESLENIFLHDNAALNLPLEVLGSTCYEIQRKKRLKLEQKDIEQSKPREIIEYYFRVRDGSRPLNEAKLILVGRGGVGKTTLVNRLNGKPFKKGEKKTEGIKITEWPLCLNQDEHVRLNIWDFGGQEIMHATHQFFLTQRSLYLVVLNGREETEEADADYWLKLIESFGGDSPVIVVLNKIEEYRFDLNRIGFQRKYPNIRKFIKTDCKSGEGLDELRKTIEIETDGLEHLRDAFPLTWFKIKDRLGRMRKNYLSYDEYRKICKELGEKDKKAQERLTVHLHNLGIALNYKDDSRLKETNVLNPRWVTNSIYKIINSSKLEKQKGVIRLDDLPSILDERSYPKNMHNFLFDLMKKFDLCFNFPDDSTQYLIPELLDKQQPEAADEFDPNICLNFQYHYTVLAEGLLPRLIVRTHTLSEDTPRWRTGVILKFEGNRALVRADTQDKKIFISVIGPDAGRRRLLAVVRSEFERIHFQLRNQPQEMVPLPDYPKVVIGYKKLLTMEEHGVKEFPEAIDGEIVMVNIYELLNGVDLKGARRKEKILGEQKKAIRLFCSYSHKDEWWRDRLETHLKLMYREGLIELWHDRKIEAGDEWKREIDENLERADVILLLISSDFIASDYCYEKEMMRALERHKAGEAKVIPVIVREVSWKRSPFAKLQVLPKDGKPVTKWPDKDSAWRNVSEGVERVVVELRDKQRGRKDNSGQYN